MFDIARGSMRGRLKLGVLRTPRNALYAAAVSLVGLVATGVIGLLSPMGHRFDALTLHGFTGLYRPRLAPAIELVMQVGNPPVYALLGALLAGVAVRRGRPLLAVAVVGILFASEGTTELLKPLLGGARPPDWVEGGWAIGQASWPSGHATAAISLSMCAILVTPSHLRHITATVGGLLSITVGYALVVTAAHLASDVIGAVFVSAFWTAAALALLWRRHHGVTRRPVVASVKSAIPLAVMGGLAAIAMLAALATRPQAVARYLPSHAVFLCGALAVASAVALALTALTHMTSGFEDRLDTGPRIPA